MPKMVCAGLFAFAAGMAFGQFEVASVKPNSISKGNGEGRYRESITAVPGSLTMRNVSLKSALQWAYSAKTHQISGPPWLAEERYDILAKAAAKADETQLRKMLQALLTERFKMMLHHETRQLSVYALVAAKNGPKMPEGNPAGQSALRPDGAKLVVTDTSMEELADILSTAASRVLNLETPVVDQSGLKGRYSFTLDGAAFLETVRPSVRNTLPDPDIIINAVAELLQSQLGLKAELRKMPVDLIVVDRAEKIPVEN